MQEQQGNHTALHVLNDYLRFEKKIYQVFGVPLGRPIAFKAVGYFLILFLSEIVIYFTPILGKVLHVVPFVILIAIPVALAYLLADVQTEGRSSVAFFRSVFLFQLRKQKQVTYIRDKELAKPTTYSFKGFSTITSTQTAEEKHWYKILRKNQRRKNRNR